MVIEGCNKQTIKFLNPKIFKPWFKKPWIFEPLFRTLDFWNSYGELGFGFGFGFGTHLAFGFKNFRHLIKGLKILGSKNFRVYSPPTGYRSLIIKSFLIQIDNSLISKPGLIFNDFESLFLWFIKLQNKPPHYNRLSKNFLRFYFSKIHIICNRIKIF